MNNDHKVNTEQNTDIAQPGGEKASAKILAFDYLRGFVIVLVLAHHSFIAYTTFVQPNPEIPWANVSPVIDSQRWVGFDVIVGLNDLYFMQLLFFISGFFIWGSLKRKGVRRFLHDRFVRLGIPFLIGFSLLIPLALFPAQLQFERIHGESIGFIEFWLGLAKWGFPTAGPLWFIWLLLSFNLLVALFFRASPDFGDRLQGRGPAIFKNPLAFLGALFVITTAAWLILGLVFKPYDWIGIGPFRVQASRTLLYLAYFLAGTVVGAYGLNRTFFTSDSKLVKRWLAWLVICIAFYMVLYINASDSPPGLLLFFVVTLFGATAIFSLIAIFLRFTKGRVAFMDSLSANSYGMYIVHYLFAIWLQYAMLDVELNAIPKGLIVFTGTLVLSWAFIALIRRIPAVARVI